MAQPEKILSIPVTEQLHTEFRMAVKKDEITMSGAIRTLIRMYLSGDILLLRPDINYENLEAGLRAKKASTLNQ